MSYNGSGVFNINTAGQPVVTGTTISSSDFNTLMTDIASGLSTALTKDGQTAATANIPLGGFKITGLGLGTATTDAARIDNANSMMCEFRLTLTTGTPVTTADVTAATTLYFSPFRGNKIALFDGTNWVMRTSAELSLAVPATTVTMYDLFAYDNAGTVAIEALAWTNDTTRATALTLQNGVLSKTGALTRRYVGSFRTTGVSGQTEDSLAKRYVWNYYNRVVRPMRVYANAASWTYSTATIRQANGSTANQLDLVMGYGEDAVWAEINTAASNNFPLATLAMQVGVGVDSTTAFSTGNVNPQIGAPGSATENMPLRAAIRFYPGVGRHYLSWNEYASASGVTTWQGDVGTAGNQGRSAIFGEVMG